MNNQGPCDEWSEKIATEKDLSPVDRVALEEHLRSCAACANTLKDYATLASHLRIAMNNEPVFPLTSRVVELREELILRRTQEQQNIAHDQYVASERTMHHSKQLEQPISTSVGNGQFVFGLFIVVFTLILIVMLYFNVVVLVALSFIGGLVIGALSLFHQDDRIGL